MKRLLVIAAHGAVDSTVERHIPFWNRSGCELLIVSNADDPSKFANFKVGKSSHFGTSSIARLQEFWKHAYSLNYGSYVFGEYDTVTFRSVPDYPNDGIVRTPTHINGDSRFKSKRYTHPILWIDRHTLGKVISLFDTIPLDAEGGFGDRWLALLFEENGIPFQHDFTTFSQNSIDREDYFIGAETCLKNGGWAVHGVKTLDCLNRLNEKTK